MRWIKLWSVRPESDYAILEKWGVYHTDDTHVLNHRLEAYYWMAEQLAKKVPPPKGVNLPVWAWYRAYGLKQIKPDLRKKGHLQSGERGVRIEFNAPEDMVLLSNFDAWHSVLNNNCFAVDDKEYEFYEKLQETSSLEAFDKIKKETWQKIFDLDIVPDPNIYEVQAVLWEIRKEWVEKVDFFIAR